MNEMRCFICNEANWYVRKDLNPKRKIGICKNCGNVVFLLDEENEEKAIKEFYRNHYRKDPTPNNILFSTHKLNWIKLFISEYLKENLAKYKQLKKQPIFADIGAGTGFLCFWFKNLGYKVTGTELPRGFRAFSEHFYGIPLTEELTEKHKYDFISLYHTLEHLVNPDKKIKYYLKFLEEDGTLLISTPEWFNILFNIAMMGNNTIENYFHENHLNCFSRISLKNLFLKNNLEIVKENYYTYGQTYLVKRKKNQEKTPQIIKENWETINNKIDKIKEALNLKLQNKSEEAIDVWYRFPDAHIQCIFDKYRKDPTKQEDFFKKIVTKDKEFSNYPTILTALGTWLYQNDRPEESLKVFRKMAELKPTEDIFIYMGWALSLLGKNKEAMGSFNAANQINPQKWTEIANWLCRCSCKLPTWDERAKEEIKENLFKKANPKIELKNIE